MSRAVLPWSWVGFPFGGLISGASVVPLMWLTGKFRRGLDADVQAMWMFMTPVSLAFLIMVMAVFALAGLVVAYGAARLLKLGSRGFVLLAAGVFSLPVLATNLYYAVDEIFRPTVGVVRFEASSLTYLPNYLLPASIAVAMGAGALVYLAVARAKQRRSA